MKRNDLIARLMELPDDAEIVVVKGDDILGDYYYATELSIEDNIGKQNAKGTIWTRFSNYTRIDDSDKKVWVIDA
jgi:hypothetical protein